MFGRFRFKAALEKIHAEFFQIFQRQADGIEAINALQAVKIHVAAQMRVRDFLREDVDQGVFALDAAGEREIRQFRPGQKFRLMLALMQDNLLHVIERDAEPRVHFMGFFEAMLNQFRADQLADERAGHDADVQPDNLRFHLVADLLGGAAVKIGFPNQRVDDALFIPFLQIFAGGSDVQLFRHRLCACE